MGPRPPRTSETPREEPRHIRIWTPGRVALVVTCTVLIVTVHIVLVCQAHKLLLAEMRGKARNLAATVAMQLDAAALERIHGPEDMETPEFQRVLDYFREVRRIYKEIRFIYCLRPSEGHGENRWEFVVDAQPYDVDLNQDGQIQAEEEGVKPGHPYEHPLSRILGQALSKPVATQDFYTDRWGTFLSGYAPVRQRQTGQTVGVLGVDIKRSTIRAKYRTVHVAAGLSLGVILALMITAFGALFGKAKALQVTRRMDRDIKQKNRQLQERNTELAKTVEQLRQWEQTMSEEMMLAREVQQRFLPRESPFPRHLRYANMYQPCAQVSGDLAEIFRVNEKTVGFYMTDVSGHGVSAALITAILRGIVERHHQNGLTTQTGSERRTLGDPETLRRFMRELNNTLSRTLMPGRYATFLLGVLDVTSGRLMMANAGHLSPLVWRRRTGELRPIEVPCNLALGFVPDWNYELVEDRIEPGDKIILYTDGIIEQINPQNLEFSQSRLAGMIESHAHLGADELVRRIHEGVRQFARSLPPNDDQAMMAVEILWLGPVGTDR